MPSIANGYLLLLCQKCGRLLGWRISEIKRIDVPEQKYVCVDCGKEYGL